MGLEAINEDIRLLKNLIYDKSGMHLEGTRLSNFCSVLSNRMQLLGVDSANQYYNFLLFHPEGRAEIEELLSEITINETYFFRNSLHFSALKDHILTKHIKDREDGIIRIWSAGCSTGEEPYSIAMVVMDLVNNHKDVKIEILGTDVDKSALEKARTGLYKRRALRCTEEPYISRYFNKNTDSFEVCDRLKNIVKFEYLNLMDTNYPKPSTGKWDIIFCRNVFIYFDRKSVQRVADNFYDSLSDEGYLFIGHSETLDGISRRFYPVEIADTFIYVKDSIPALEVNSLVITEPTTSQKSKTKNNLSRTIKNEKRSEIEKTRDNKTERVSKPVISIKHGQSNLEAIYEKASELFENGKDDEALTEIKTYIESRPQDAKGHLLAGKIYADKGIYEHSVSAFEESIKLDPLLTEAHYLLGVIYQKLGEVEKAIDEFKKSAYIDQNCALTHFSLACLYQSKNMDRDALREYKNAVRILERFEEGQIVRFSGGYTVKLLTQMCEKNIVDLSN
jgi:chemotaxis protein methyltransferase CheR